MFLHICCLLQPVIRKGGKVSCYIFNMWKYLYWIMEKKKSVYPKYTAAVFLDTKKKLCYFHRGLDGNTELCPKHLSAVKFSEETFWVSQKNKFNTTCNVWLPHPLPLCEEWQDVVLLWTNEKFTILINRKPAVLLLDMLCGETLCCQSQKYRIRWL